MDNEAELRAAVSWVVTALGGRAGAGEVGARLAPRLSQRGDVAAYLAGGRRFAAFREHEPVVDSVAVDGWEARALVRTGPRRWD